MTQYVKNLDLAVDMHISLVQMHQYASQGLTEGKDFRTAIQDAIELVQKERAASGALALRLRFRSFFKQSCSLTEHNLDQAIRDWENLRLRKGAAAHQESAGKQQEQKERQERREAAREERAEKERRKAERREARLLAKETKQERLRSKRQAFALRKLRSFQAFVKVRQAHFEKLRKKQLLKTWGVAELPECLRLCSFQGRDDCLCAVLRLSDGRLQAGPYRKSLQEALRDLQELRVIQQRKGDEVLCEEMQRRDAVAMTAFFMQSLN